MASYTLHVHTGNRRGAGCKAAVRVDLASKRNDLTIKFSERAYPRDSVTSLQIEDVDDLGSLRGLRVTAIPYEDQFTWFLSRIVVESTATGAQWTFSHQAWLDEDKTSQDLELLDPFLAFRDEQVPNWSGGFLSFGGALRPHPSKLSTGGEDAILMTQLENNSSMLCVADGVGDWAAKGVDAGLFARRLLDVVEESMLEKQNQGLSLLEILEGAWAGMSLEDPDGHGMVQGSSTLCALHFDSSTGVLNGLNLGDSGFLIIRDGDILLSSHPHEHSFGFPFQLSSVDGDAPKDADLYQITLKKGDIIVAGSDGLWDNLYDREVCGTVWSYRQVHTQALADNIARVAFERSVNTRVATPFADNMREELEIIHAGGKMDDISVIVARVGKRASKS